MLSACTHSRLGGKPQFGCQGPLLASPPAAPPPAPPEAQEDLPPSLGHHLPEPLSLCGHTIWPAAAGLPEPHVRVEWRCPPYTQQSPLQPVIAHLHRLLRWHPDGTPEEKPRSLEETLTAYGFALPEVVPLFAVMLSLPLPERYPPLTLAPQRQRQQTLEALLTWLLAEATRQPVLFIVEDLHWIDPSTLEFLTLLLDRGPTARLCTLLTCRPEFAVPWGFRAHLTPLTLTRLPQLQVTQMIEHVAGGKALPPRWSPRLWPRPMACRYLSKS
jgi:hypothetical protein